MESDPLIGNQDVEDEQPLLVHHVARICAVSRRTVRWAASKGILKGFKDPTTPKIWRFRRSDVYAYRALRAGPQDLPVVVEAVDHNVQIKENYHFKLTSLKY